jgi:release factor glutamine methyltransferase
MIPFSTTSALTIRAALEYGRSHLAATSPTPHLDARLLLQYTMDVSHSSLIAHAHETLTAVHQQQYLAYLNRAAQYEPIPYITGRAPFYGLDFIVNPAVLIPRPETEQLVDIAIHWAKPHGALHIVDVGTGSGCIPIALACHLPQATLQATDVSPAALVVARQNVRLLAPGRVTLHQGHLLAPITTPIHLLTANLPYVSDGEWTMLDDGVKLHEPALALRGGPDGLTVIGQLLAQATTKLTPGGLMILEIGWQQGAAAHALAERYFPAATIEIRRDFAGHDRFVVIRNGNLIAYETKIED